MTAYTERLSQKDKELIAEIAEGRSFSHANESSPKYKELVSGLLLQLADSELAGASGYSQLLHLGPDLICRLELSKIVHEKFLLATSAYKLVSELGVNVEKYFLLHSWEARIQRHAQLGYRRASSDKRLNALMYPLHSWPDISVFTYMMASMARLQFEEFSQASFLPLAKLAADSLNLERRHAEHGLNWLKGLDAPERAEAQLSINYWFEKVLKSFGPKDSEGNIMHREFRLKHRSNEDLAKLWRSEINSALSQLNLQIPEND
ncbi:MAG: phenylacetate-CoA oxygenase subunit PaaI [Candidatus Obscuribacterales bacterium]|nr:phenylacetate-CoA oxygenase subunit PaaI [Candidatus Obscuribacterales bacterium]